MCPSVTVALRGFVGAPGSPSFHLWQLQGCQTLFASHVEFTFTSLITSLAATTRRLLAAPTFGANFPSHDLASSFH